MNLVWIYFFVSFSDVQREYESFWNCFSSHQQTVYSESRSLLSSWMVQLDFNES